MAKRNPEAEKKDNRSQLCSRCRRDTVDYVEISRRGSRKMLLCRECIRKGL